MTDLHFPTSKVILTLSLLSAGGLLACSQISTIPRDQLTANLAPILKVGERADQVKATTQILGLVGQMTAEKVEELKEMDRGDFDVVLTDVRMTKKNMTGS